MQRHQDMIASGTKSADPVLRVALAGVAHQVRAFGGAGDERAGGVERERRDTISDLQRDQPGPGDADIEAIVGVAFWDIGGVATPPPPGYATPCPPRPVLGRAQP